MRITMSKSNNEENKASLPSVIGVLGSKGGVGATTFAVNLATALSTDDGQVVLLDANLQQPDAALMLAASIEYSLVDLIMRSAAVEKKIFEACSTIIPSSNGLRLITPPMDGSAAASCNLSQVAECLQQVAPFAKTFVVDLPKHLDRHLVTTIDMCGFVLLVVEANMASIAASKRWLANFEDLGYQRDKIIIVANRVGGKLKFVEQQLFMSFDGYKILGIANAYSAIEQCSIEGVPIVLKQPRDSYSKCVKMIARTLRETVKEKMASAS